MLVLVILVFAAHMLRGRPAVETLLFSIALAVGLSPELLPAILSINLARGARMLARQGVLVRRLNAIENLGSMDVLCTDKTGTLTEGVVRVQDAFDPVGVPAPAVLELAAYNAALETGVSSPLDDAILDAHRPDLSGLAKCGEIPFDFARRRVTGRHDCLRGRADDDHEGRLSPRSGGVQPDTGWAASRRSSEGGACREVRELEPRRHPRAGRLRRETSPPSRHTRAPTSAT
jgi:magnesium-transporting ATPase (P-type)